MSSDIKVGSFEHITACCGAAVNGVIRSAMKSESTDNLSVVLLVFQNFRSVLSQFEAPVAQKNINISFPITLE
jgi:hypothetical protein